MLRALKGHTELGECGHRSPRWGEMSWGGLTQGSAPLHRWAIAVRRVAARAGTTENFHGPASVVGYGYDLESGDRKLESPPATFFKTMTSGGADLGTLGSRKDKA